MDDKGFLDYAEGDEKIESARLNRDAQEYYRLCNFYGKKTRDEELYEEGSGGSVDVDRLKIVAYERKVAGEKRPSSLEKLAKSLGNRLQSGEEIKGEISYKVGSDVQGGYCDVTLSYDFPRLHAEDSAFFDSEKQAHEKALEGGIENLSHYLKQEEITATKEVERGNILGVIVKRA